MFKLLPLFFLCWFSLAHEEASLAKAVAKETSLDRLKVGATRYVALMDVADYSKWKKKFQEKLDQKVADSRTSEDAVINQYILDYASDHEKVLIAGPNGADPKFIMDLARHIALGTEKNFVWKDWTKREREIMIWGEWFLKTAPVQDKKP